MRNLRKLTAVVIAVALVLTSMTTAFAAFEPSYGEEAEILNELGLYAGVSSTEFDPDLESDLTREQATMLLLKLFGLAEDAAALTDDEVAAALEGRTDAGKVSDWAKNAVAYALENEIMSGKSTTTVNPKDKIKAAEFATLILKTMGYEVADWTEAVAQLSDVEGSAVSSDVAGDLLRDDAVGMMFGALTAQNADGKTVIEVIVGDDADLKAIAVDAGLIEDAALTASVTATGAKVITAKFSSAVDTAKAAFAIKKGTVTVNVSKVEWNADKTEAKITLVSALTAGDYTVTVNGLELEKNAFTITAEAEKVASIEITSEIAPLVSGTTNISFPYVIKNQYGEDVTSAYASSLIWTPSTGTFGADPATGKKLLTGSFAKDNTVTVTAIYAAGNVATTKLLKVGEVSKVSKINVLGIYNKDAKTLFTDSDFSTFYVKVEAFDQYGSAATVAQLNDATQTTVVSSNGTVVTKGSFVTIPDTSIIGLQLVKPASNVAGTATINFITNINGQSAQATVVVEKPATLTKFTLETPADLVVAGESIKIPFTAQDQNGVELTETQKAAIPTSIFKTSYTGMTFGFAYNYQTKKAELTLTVADTVASGAKLIMAATDAGNVSQITVDVKAVAVPVAVSGVKNFATLLSVGANSAVTDSDIVVVDNYGRAMTLDSAWFAKYRLDFTTSAPSYVTMSAISIAADDGSLNLSGVAAGSSTIGVSIFDKAASVNKTIANSLYEFTAQTVAKSAISEYVVEVPEVLYTATSHKKAVTVYGKNSAGSKVALAAGDYVVTTNDTGVVYSAGYLDANGSANPSATVDKTATIIVVIDGANGPESITKTVKVTNSAPKVTTVSAEAATGITVSGDTLYVKVANVTTAGLSAAITAKDQYGVSINPAVTNLLATSISGVTITNNGTSNPTFTSVDAADTFTLTFITQSGVNKTVNVVVVPN